MDTILSMNYRYRMLYNAAFFNLLARNGQVEVCKSRRHSDGKKCFGSDDWFIVMAILPTGQVSNHYEANTGICLMFLKEKPLSNTMAIHQMKLPTDLKSISNCLVVA